MYKIVPKNEKTLQACLKHELRVLLPPSAASFLVKEEREKLLPNWPYNYKQMVVLTGVRGRVTEHN